MKATNSHKSEWLDSWHVNPSVNKDYLLLDGLRGVAIIMVLGAHFIYVNPNSNVIIKFLGGIFTGGFLGVRIFFALSGFLISWPFWKRKFQGAEQVVPTGYGWRRFWKIYPPLALSVLIFTPIYVLNAHDASFIYTATQWLTGLSLVMPVSGKFNPVMWSLIVEMHFYIILPFIFVGLKRISPKSCLWIITSVFLVIPIGYRWIVLNGDYFTLKPQINVHFPSLLDSFALGVLMAGLDNLGVIKKNWAKLGNVGFMLVAFSMLCFSMLMIHNLPSHPIFYESMMLTAQIGSGLLLCYVADPTYVISNWLSVAWLRWCGIISYEWYLFHQAILWWMRPWFGSAHGNLLNYGLNLGIPFIISLALAATVYRYFSLPILKFGRKRNEHGSS
jgi:peptidoglycan/LPS O-acetylase OafA/YrhL